MNVPQPRYSKEHKDKAKELNQPLFTLDIDERHVVREGKRTGRRRTVQGLLNHAAEPLARAVYRTTVLDQPEPVKGGRDFEALPYHELEARVAAYIVEMTGVGGGDDPIGTLIASHRVLSHAHQELLHEKQAPDAR